MSPKEQYRLLCEDPSQGHIPIYQQHWWMNTVCQGKEWDVAFAHDSHGNLMAAMPYLLRKRYGLKYILQPQLTPFSGPTLFFPASLSQRRRTDFAHQAFASLINHIESLHLAHFQQCFSPDITDWLPFYWRGYNQTTRYTYHLPDISNPEAVFEQFDKGKERQRRIRQMASQYSVDTNLTAQEFATFHEAYWRSRGQKDLLSKQLITSVIDSSMKRNQGLLMGLRTTDGTLSVAWFCVYDSHCAHALLSAMSTDRAHQSATPLLIWRLIQHLSPLTRTFDFEGSMHPSTEYFYRSFGAQQIAYMQISKTPSPFFRMLLKMKR